MTTELLSQGYTTQDFTTEIGDQAEILIPAGCSIALGIKTGNLVDAVSLKGKLIKDEETYTIQNSIAGEFVPIILDNYYSVFISIDANDSNSFTVEAKVIEKKVISYTT